MRKFFTLSSLWCAAVLMVGCAGNSSLPTKSHPGLSDEQARQRAVAAVRPLFGPGEESNVRTVRREDLEERLKSLEVAISSKDSRVPFFYKVIVATKVPAGTGRVTQLSSTYWIVGVSTSSPNSYVLCGNPNAMPEFNSLVREVRGVAIRNGDDAVSLIRIYFSLAQSGTIVLAEDMLQAQQSVQRFFYEEYGEGREWKEKYLKWWGELSSRPPGKNLIPSSQLSGSSFRVTLHPMVLAHGTEPRIDELELLVAADGRIEELSRRIAFKQ